MSGRRKKSKRILVRSENPTGACGITSHMTIDELKERAVGDEFDGTCPACGLFHLTREEVERAEKIKITKTEKYRKLCEQAGDF
jgi:hypothetical protein